ncbi:MAG: hypothetical protein GOVbin3205_53 [Prokaryotic dsDNA virus sp.]|nr:MAG: hypothetical protein GOVbin3205_53 [Prokaryotic dsDNA virus sp.]|tara:strand:+ start:1513 stop:1944 length:432 start_codon:yes stop_codon:yes gene_type:complete
MSNSNSNYLKYWRVIRYFIKAKYGLTQADLDVLLFLYSEKYFSKDRFEEFDELLSWDVNRFDKLLRDKWIEVFRKASKNKRGIYQLSYKTVRIISGIYDKLEGKEIPTSTSFNPMFAKNVSYTDKVYRNFIIELNKEIRESKK